MSLQLAFGHDGKIDLWCEDRGIDENGGQRFWVINGHWDGVYHRGKVFVNYTGGIFPAKLIWRGKTPFKRQDYNEACAWLRSYLRRRPDLKYFFEKMEFSMKKSFKSVVEELDVAGHNERVEALAGAFRSVNESIAGLEKRLAEARAYAVELSEKGETVEALSDEDYSKLYNRHFSFNLR